MDTDILTLAEVARTLSMQEEAVEALLDAGELPGRRIGENWFVSRRKLLAFIEGEGDAPPRQKPMAKPTADANVFPFTNNWRCGRCDHLNDSDRVECAHCGRARSIPLINFRLGS